MHAIYSVNRLVGPRSQGSARKELPDQYVRI